MSTQPALRCRSAAKINLTLDILGQRDDGYHLLRSVVHTVDWWDELHFTPRADGSVSLSCSRRDLETPQNLCVRAAQFFREAANMKSGVHIYLHKNIPSGAGLGGGSGNAAAVLLALNTLARGGAAPGRVLSESELASLALRLGADVPFFLRGGCALMEGIGEKLTPLPALQGCALLVQPSQTLETRAVYAAHDDLQIPSQNCTEDFLKAISLSTQARDFADFLGNDLEAAATRLGVNVSGLKSELRRSGALGAAMSGSGSCVFGIFENQENAHKIAETMHNTSDLAVRQSALLQPHGVEFMEATRNRNAD